MKPNFVWKAHGTKPLQVNPEYELCNDLALVVLIGMSEMYGFAMEEVVNYLGVDERSYYKHLKTYRSHMEKAADRMGTVGMSKKDLTERVWTKTRLVQNSLNISGTSLFDLNDMPNV